MDNPAITVFMAAYNSTQYIAESIQSILTQTFGDFELLIVNDGSTDGTLNVVTGFRDSRIRVINNARNMGLTYTRNIALTEAKGRYIAILDSDDVALPNRLEWQYQAMIQRPELALIGGHSYIIDQGGRVKDEQLIVQTGVKRVKMTLLFNNTYVNSSTMFRSDVFRELKGYRDCAPIEDYDLFIRISERYAVDNLDKFLVKYRIHDKNISSIQLGKAKMELKEMKRDQLTKLRIDTSKNYQDILLSLLMLNYQDYSFRDYQHLFRVLKAANRRLKKYPSDEFNRFLFEKWYLIIREKNAQMNALTLLLNKYLFNCSYVTIGMLRETLKMSIFGWGKISR